MDDYQSLKLELAQTQMALQMAGQINLLKAGLLGRTSHELRSPLSSLMSLLQLILNDLCEDPQEEREFLRQAYGAASKLLEMIDQVVLVSKLDYGSIALNLHPIALLELLREVYSLTHLQAANRNIRLTVDLLEPMVYLLADESQLLSLLVMMVDLAIRRQEGGEIKITTNCQNNRIEIVLVLNMPISGAWWQDTEKIPPIPHPITLSALSDWNQTLHLSLGMQWQLAKIIVEKMGGNLRGEQKSDKSAETMELYFEFPQVMLP